MPVNLTAARHLAPVPGIRVAATSLGVRKIERAAGYREELGAAVMAQAEIHVRIELGRGDASACVWTCDLSHDYVSINADYRS